MSNCVILRWPNHMEQKHLHEQTISKRSNIFKIYLEDNYLKKRKNYNTI